MRAALRRSKNLAFRILMYLCVVQMFITAKPAQLGFQPVRHTALSRTLVANFSMYLKEVSLETISVDL